MSRILPAVALALSLGVAATGCGASAGASGVHGPAIRPLARPALTGTVAGLATRTENVHETVRAFRDSYADRVGVYSLRGAGALQATLQVSHFVDGDRLRDATFRRGLVELVGGSAPQLLRVAGRDVYVLTGTGQRIFVWFRASNVFVLSVRSAYRSRYALLRAVLVEAQA